MTRHVPLLRQPRGRRVLSRAGLVVVAGMLALLGLAALLAIAGAWTP